MKNTLFFLCVSVLLFSCDTTKQQVIQLKMGKPVNPNLYGFNMERAACFCRNNMLPEGKERFAELKPQNVRFPGGTSSNYFHVDSVGIWEGFVSTETQNKQVITTEDLQKARITTENQNQRLQKPSTEDEEKENDVRRITTEGQNVAGSFRAINEKLVLEQTCKWLKVNPMQPFSNLMKSQPQTEVVFVANLLTSNFDNLRRSLHYLEQNNVTVSAVEMGNEMYLPRYEIAPDKYMKKAKRFADSLRLEFPNIKIGVSITTPLLVHESLIPSFREWNQEVAKHDFYDGVIMHYYIRNYAQCGESDFSCMSNLILSNIEKEMPKVMNECQQLFPNKKIWLTEWGLSKQFKSVSSSQLHNLINAVFFQKLLTEYGDIVECAQYHNLLAGGELYPMLAPDNRANPTAFNKRATFLLFENISDIVKNGTVSLSGTEGVFPATQGILTYAYWHPSDGLSMVIVNTSGGNVSFDVKDKKVQIQNSMIDCNKGSLKTIKADALNAVYNKDKKEIQVAEMNMTGGQLTLPKYSINMLNFK